MSYFEPHIDEKGIHIPEYEDIRDYLIEKYKTIFGEDIDLNEETPDYQMISIYAKCMSDSMGALVDNYNARNPNYATGDSLDLILEMNGVRRKEGTSSTCELYLTGISGATITMGNLAIDKNGYLWELSSDCQLDAEGKGFVNSFCRTKGRIEAPSGTIDTIFSDATQWHTVTNLVDATPGLDVETDAEVRLRRYNEIVVRGYGLRESMYRALFEIDVMLFVDILSNDTGVTDANGIPGHSICAVVWGGDMTPGSEKEIKFKNEVAAAIWEYKAPGVGTYGNTSVTYIDPDSHENTINFMISTKKLISVSVSITTLPNYDGTRVVPLIKQAIMNEINVLGPGVSWNVTMAYKDIYVSFDDEDCPFIVNSVSGTKQGDATVQTVTIPCAFNELFYATEESITITTT